MANCRNALWTVWPLWVTGGGEAVVSSSCDNDPLPLLPVAPDDVLPIVPEVAADHASVEALPWLGSSAERSCDVPSDADPA